MKNFEGMKAPGFTLPGNDGKKHSLDEFKDCCAVFLSEGQHPWLNQGGLRVSRAELSVQREQYGGHRD